MCRNLYDVDFRSEAYIFGDYGGMYESNYFHLPIPENMSEGMKVARCPMVRVKRRYEKGIEG